MGTVTSILWWPWSGKRLSKQELQRLILEYLGSDDYLEDPYQYFSDISSYGYDTLEKFIAEIPQSDATDQIIYRHIASPVPSLGIRYVLFNEPWKRGMLAERISILPDGNWATLLMDQIRIRRAFFYKCLSLFINLLFPLRLLFPKFVGSVMPPSKPQYCSYTLDQLVPEKIHLLAYLPRNEFDFQGNLVHPAVKGQEETGNSSMGNSIYVSSPPTNCEPIHQHKVAQSIELPKKKKKSSSTTKPSSTKPIPPGEESQIESVPPVSLQENGLPVTKVQYVGRHKGIEGAHNSCYMDSLLFSMFYTSSAFDFLLEPKSGDTKFMKKTRRILRDNVIAPLRQTYYCDYESVMTLREHLSRKNEDLMGAFMDAEQILYLLGEEVLKEAPFIQYAGVDDDGWGDFMHLMSINPSGSDKVITVQQNVETSFAFNGDIRMANVPSPALILGMPRSNRELIHYEAVIPNVEIDIEGLLETVRCHKCGGEAQWEVQPPIVTTSTDVSPICDNCIAPAMQSQELLQSKIVSRNKMRLKSIICIRGVHFVAFVWRSHDNHENTRDNDAGSWLFFDSMAGGYPEVKVVPKLEKWLKEVASHPDNFYTRKIPALVKRAFTDGHLCIYEPIQYKSSYLS